MWRTGPLKRIATWALVLFAAGLVATGCSSASGKESRAASHKAATVASTSTTATSSVPTMLPTPAPTTTSTTLSSAGLPISVQSDSQMQAEGNNGPTSSILMPTSCELVGTTVTASGTYQGGFAGNGYSRYGDVVELYVFTAPMPQYPPPGIVMGFSSVSTSPAIGGYGSWKVTASIDPSIGQPASCVVAAQPTHDEILAP
jgi:hypothetical protein